MKTRSIFVIAVLLFLVYLPSYSYAQEEQASSSPKQAVTPTQTPIDYKLPYPGILPDNPLYFIKTFRDRLVGFLISDPVRKAEFDVLQADKRIGMGDLLVDKKKWDLSYSTISKGENYFQEAIDNAQLSKKEHKNVSATVRKLSASIQKHIQVTTSLVKKVPSQKKQEFISLEERAEELEKKVKLVLPEK